jgi:ribosomal protein L29
MRSREEIQKTIEALKKEQMTEGPFTERRNIARIATRQALEWVLGEVDNPLTY